MRLTGDTSCKSCTWNNPKRIGKETGRLGHKRMSGGHPNYSIVKIGQNTEMSPGDLRRLAINQTPLKGGVKNSLEVIYIYVYIYMCVCVRARVYRNRKIDI